jgi:hypothetical protein
MKFVQVQRALVSTILFNCTFPLKVTFLKNLHDKLYSNEKPEILFHLQNPPNDKIIVVKSCAQIYYYYYYHTFQKKIQINNDNILECPIHCTCLRHVSINGWTRVWRNLCHLDELELHTSEISSCLIILDRGTVSPSEWKVRKGIQYRDKHYFCRDKGGMALTTDKRNPGMAAGKEGPLSQTSNINIMKLTFSMIVIVLVKVTKNSDSSMALKLLVFDDHL